MPALAFTELTNQVHLLNDIILEDMIFAKDERERELLKFNRHLFTIKNWFTRISASNKKGFLLALFQDIKAAWTLSNVMICIWNSRTKDAVMSICESIPLSCYDRMPMDHNRTAQPLETLAQVMKSDRKWILSLDSDQQATVICELLSVAGGPVMWEILNRGQVIYERYRDNQIKNIEMSIMVPDPPPEKPSEKKLPPPPQAKENLSKNFKSSDLQQALSSKSSNLETASTRKKLDKHLEQWNATIKSLKDRLGLVELEVVFKDGTKRNVWKVKRTKPEDIETVDFVQLLPSPIGKRIISYLPKSELGNYARVNKYWAYLVEDFKAEEAARANINADLEKLQELMSLHDTSMDLLECGELNVLAPSARAVSLAPSIKIRAQQVQQEVDTKASIKSAGVYSFRHFINKKMEKPNATAIQVPIKSVAEMTSRLDSRGALDDNLWMWCGTVLNQRTAVRRENEEGQATSGVLSGNQHFPCPLMSQALNLPLYPPLTQDHTGWSQVKLKQNISNATDISMNKDRDAKRVNLWTRNLSCLYHAFKVPSYSDIV